MTSMASALIGTGIVLVSVAGVWTIFILAQDRIKEHKSYKKNSRDGGSFDE